MMTSVLHFGGSLPFAPLPSDILSGVLVLAGIGSLLLVGLALAALARRQSRSYLLVTLALATLLARTVVGGLAVKEAVPVGVHHMTEHSLDIVMAALLIAAVYCARTIDPSAEEERA